MSHLTFTWNEEKAQANRRKHKVSFEDAMLAFKDDYALMMFDPDHSEYEDRWVLIGMILPMRHLVVCYKYDEETNTVRIISARKAKTAEIRNYMEKRR